MTTESRCIAIIARSSITRYNPGTEERHMNWADSAAAAAVSEIEENAQRELTKGTPVRLVELAARIFALDWLLPDGTQVHQVVDFRGEQLLAYIELKEPGV